MLSATGAEGRRSLATESTPRPTGAAHAERPVPVLRAASVLPNRVGGRARQNGGVAQLDDAERSEREAQLRNLIDLMRPAVQADGGDLELLSFDVEAGTVEVQLQGACSSCAISSATLQGGVERILRDRLPWVTEVTGGVDETFDLTESVALGRGAYVPRLP
jgi:Fe-S cluster biogenesis protein NfuA